MVCQANNSLARLATASNKVLRTNNSGDVSWNATLPDAVMTNITKLGTVSTGTWNSSVIAGLYGGTGVANSGKMITLVNDC